MGLMLAATDGVLPGTTWLYFALSQFPIYLSPQLIKPIVRRLSVREVGVGINAKRLPGDRVKQRDTTGV
jgi:hypothetical protein